MDESRIFGIWRAMLIRRLNAQSAAALSVYPDARELYDERQSAAMLLSPSEGRRLLGYDLAEARQTAELCEREGIDILLRSDKDYPPSFEHLPEPPGLLYLMGRREALLSRSCAVVGARQAEGYAFELTRRLSYRLAERGITVISGFAVGIDRAAHLGALDANGVTVAVLGCGLLTDYPRGSHQLRDRIAMRGAVITEYAPLEAPLPGNFLRRNRLTAALAECVLCTQASQHSGSLSTANLAMSQGKQVFVTPPHDILSGSCAGIVSLLRDGAVQIYSAEDIIENCF